jgi:DNA-binding transcriptional LysR family regulator
MPDVGLPTHDQLRLFQTVVETGSFAAAARKLNRAVSAVSYGINNFEAQLGVKLFDREATRKPVLTDAGRAILAEACEILSSMDALRAKVQGLRSGLEAEVNLAVDVMLPTHRVGHILREFAQRYPTVSLRLHVETLGGVAVLVLDGQADLGISGPLPSFSPELETIVAGSVPLIPVAGKEHPLAQQDRIPIGAAREHLQLVLSDRTRFTEGRDFGVVSPRTWRLADLGAKHALLIEGIGWGSMPLPMIEADLQAGRLKRLAMPDYPGGIYRFTGIWRKDHPPGPAGSWLREELVAAGRTDVELPGMTDL